MVTYRIPRKILVFTVAKISNAFDIFFAKIWVKVNMPTTNAAKKGVENIPKADVIIKNQSENPAETATALNLGDEMSISDRVNQCNKSSLC